jgi:hypothetical protein
MLLTTQQARSWCRYLSALHTAIDSLSVSAELMMPISYHCSRVSDSIVGCGTCLRCTSQLILRALHTSTVPPADVANLANSIAGSVFEYVTTLDEKLNDPDGLGDDFTPMTSKQFAQVMEWAATRPEPALPPVPRSPLALWPLEGESRADYAWSPMRGAALANGEIQ